MSHILLVEDNHSLLEFLEDVVETTTHSASGALTLAEARQIMAQETPDIIFSDAILPDGDGIHFLEEVRSDASTRHIPFVLMSGQTLRAIQRYESDVHPNAYLLKPFTLSEFVRCLKEQLARG